MLSKHKAGMIVVLAGLLPGLSAAQDSTTCSGLLVKNNISVRAEGMGNAQAAMVVDEAGAQSFNPAGLQGLPNQEVSVMYYRGVADDNLGAINYAQPIRPGLACGAGLVVYDGGKFEWTNDLGETHPVSAQRDFLITLSGAQELKVLSWPLALGTNLKVLQSTLLSSYTALAAVADVGVRAEVPGTIKNLFVGAALKNFGTPLKYFEDQEVLPQYALVGMAYHLPRLASLGILLAADVQYDLDKSMTAQLGTELTMAKLLALRGGYRYAANLSSAQIGLGFDLAYLRVDYAFSFMQAPASVHRLGITYWPGYVSPREKSKDKKPAKTSTGLTNPILNLPADTGSVSSSVKLESQSAAEKIRVQIVAIDKVGGRITKIAVNGGGNQGIKKGYRGSVLNFLGMPIAGIIVRQVEAGQSTADVIGLSQEMAVNGMVLIERPKENE